MTTKPATPLPWVSRKSPDGDPKRTIYAKSDIGKPTMSPIADCFEEHDAYIVHACNSYPRLEAENQRLREALEPMTRGACLDQRIGDKCICYTCIARAALRETDEA